MGFFFVIYSFRCSHHQEESFVEKKIFGKKKYIYIYIERERERVSERERAER